MTNLRLEVLEMLLDLEDRPHPAQPYGEVAEQLGYRDKEDVEAVYSTLLDLVDDGLLAVGDRQYGPAQRQQTGFTKVTGFYFAERARAEAEVAAWAGESAPAPAGPRLRLSAISERLVA